MNDVFISYAREDSKVAESIAEKLRLVGLSVFVDREVLVTGENFADAIQSEIASARLVVLLLSRNARRSRWVQQELIAALEGGEGREVLPVLIDDEAEENVLWPLVANRRAIREYDTLKLPTQVTDLALSVLRPREQTSQPSRTQRRWTLPLVASISAAFSIILGMLVFWQTPDAPPNAVSLTPLEPPKTTYHPTNTSNPPLLPGQPPECRLPEHGIEDWRKIKQLVIDSGWIKGGSSPSAFCNARKAELEANSPGHEIEVKSMGERHKSEYTPFKHDFYWYTCVIEDRSDPLYKLAPNSACPANN